MLLYVTPERFKTMGLGVDLDDVEDFELRATLSRASARVNTLCAAPNLPQPHDFRGGTVTDEQHPFRLGYGPFEGAQREVFLFHWPVRTVGTLRVDLTNTQYISFTDDQLYVRNKSVEIISLAMTVNGLFGSALVPIIGLREPRCLVDYVYGYEIVVSEEQIDATDGLMYRAQNQFWTAADVVLKVGGAVQSTGFTIDRVEGTVTFDAPQAANSVVTVSYVTKLPPEIAMATALLAAASFSEREDRSRGMSGLRRLTVGEITLERDVAPRGGAGQWQSGKDAPPEVLDYLEGFQYTWVGAG